uniref:Uncharacterized protein n=1 Tax=Cucumis sativus TaxID=3659 RepID=A0A0A0KQT3_CUCSA
MGYLPNESGSSIGFRNLQNEVKHHDVWQSGEGAASTSGNSRDNLASLYRPPYHLMFTGSFEKIWKLPWSTLWSSLNSDAHGLTNLSLGIAHQKANDYATLIVHGLSITMPSLIAFALNVTFGSSLQNYKGSLTLMARLHFSCDQRFGKKGMLESSKILLNHTKN